jgi:undecaprenyl-diphosphatase
VKAEILSPRSVRSRSVQGSWVSRLTPAGLARLLGPVQVGLLAVAVVAALMFVALTLAVLFHPGPFFFDRPISVAIQAVHFAPFDPFHALVSSLGGLIGVGVGAVVIVATFLVMRRATPFVVFLTLYAVVYNGVDLLVRRPRPTGLAHTVTNLGGHSFPSGHVGFFVWLGVLAQVLVFRRLPVAWRVATGILLTVVVIAAALSRIYVGAHWPSDVVGGLLVGVGWSALTLSLGGLTRRLNRARPPSRAIPKPLAAPAV